MFSRRCIEFAVSIEVSDCVGHCLSWAKIVVAARSCTNPHATSHFEPALESTLWYLKTRVFPKLHVADTFSGHAIMAVAAAIPITPSIVGALSCQKDSYLQTLETEVVACDEHTPPKGSQQSGKAKSKKSTDPSKANSNEDPAPQRTWMIEFADSVLFPEGGGQHSDHGFITPLGIKGSAIPIENIQRHGLRCIHYSQTPLEVGTKVKQTVYYARRWDLMQQHTGQHLLSAIMDRVFSRSLYAVNRWGNVMGLGHGSVRSWFACLLLTYLDPPTRCNFSDLQFPGRQHGGDAPTSYFHAHTGAQYV